MKRMVLPCDEKRLDAMNNGPSGGMTALVQGELKYRYGLPNNLCPEVI
ncbi:MAG: hypothetical protein O2867_10035 [Bacteroidetes bacterium]|nr:hypothetical protein [Bacteroidota bacterium]